MIPEAQAQAAEAVAAGTKAADVFLDRGVLGAVCIFLILLLAIAGLVIRHLYNDVKAGNAQVSALLERFIKVTEGTNATLARVEDILEQLRATLETRGAAIVDLSRQFETIAGELRHGNNNLSQAIEGIAKWTRDLPEQVTTRVTGQISGLLTRWPRSREDGS